MRKAPTTTFGVRGLSPQTETPTPRPLDRLVRGILREWEREANLLQSGYHQRRQGLPQRQVLAEECAIRGCIADIEQALGPNDKVSDSHE